MLPTSPPRIQTPHPCALVLKPGHCVSDWQFAPIQSDEDLPSGPIRAQNVLVQRIINRCSAPQLIASRFLSLANQLRASCFQPSLTCEAEFPLNPFKPISDYACFPLANQGLSVPPANRRLVPLFPKPIRFGSSASQPITCMSGAF